MSTDDAVRRAQWDAFNQVLHWINSQETQVIRKGDLYAAVMDMRPRPLSEIPDPPDYARLPTIAEGVNHAAELSLD